ncbi:Dabb family protein [Vibrio coralliilyticus]|uniref:Dabb family protein n=1 Tax=Vibrio TaxID=662 RepID=UPI000390E16E|nr:MULTISPECIES: Dabb family protein [Vibrio]AIS56797.1 stress protein [Vibrio coralliilyticus]ERB66627.1 stress protein [Vibrio coralliilyticus OCN008]MCM5508556.1 Dabb family protein [Vibrio sp. SCSIO 43169]NOI28755.1 Dabb family protein [Vibrio coralliilyticus]NOI47649.1 Dabb family protein [Vibrio coralliilyticus]
MIRHILLIQFKSNASSQQIEELKASFLSMPTKIEGVDSVEWGLNDSPEGKNKHYTHCVMMTFADEAGRDRYLPHPEHDALKEIFRPILEDIVVFDYTV